MQETEYKRLIQSSKDRALFGFLALAQRAMQDAEKDIAQTMVEARSNLDQSTLAAVRHFLRQDGNQFLRRVDALYRTYLDRALQTMYVDFRPGLRKLSVDELSLVDDEVLTNQIEVERLAQRMRDANEESIGRLNVIIAELHGQHEARERENPFRPYLLARAIYEAIREVASDEQKAKSLFDYLSAALVEHLPGFYVSIREVFEGAGLQGKFVAQPSRAAAFQRYFGAAPLDPALAVQAQLSARVLPGLQRMFDSFQAMPATSVAAASAGNTEERTPATVEELIRKIFNPVRSSFRALAPPAPAGPLVAQLTTFQKNAAQGQAFDSGAAPEPNQLFALREKLDLDKASTMERLTVDVVAMLFEYIVGDEQIPARVRDAIAGLQIPLLKAAMLDAQLLHDERHPARELLNRLASAAIGADLASEAGQAIAAEIERIVRDILEHFDTDVSIFGSRLADFERFLSDLARREDAASAAAIDAIEAAEKMSILLTNTTTALCDALLPLNADKRLSDFFISVWPHVLIQAAWQDAEQGRSADPDSLLQQYRALLPELLWSVQEKEGAQERAALIKLLPGLVKRFNAALRLVQLPEDETREILDLLMQMHQQVLRSGPALPGKDPRSLEDLRQAFARLTVNWERVSWTLTEPPQARAALIEEVLQRKGVLAELNVGQKSLASSEADREFLIQTYLLGTRVELRGADGASQPAHLVWITSHRSLYLFRQDKDGAFVVHTFSSLLEALREGLVVPVEYAPVFERAVESLFFGAEKLQAGLY